MARDIVGEAIVALQGNPPPTTQNLDSLIAQARRQIERDTPDGVDLFGDHNDRVLFENLVTQYESRKGNLQTQTRESMGGIDPGQAFQAGNDEARARGRKVQAVPQVAPPLPEISVSEAPAAPVIGYPVGTSSVSTHDYPASGSTSYYSYTEDVPSAHTESLTEEGDAIYTIANRNATFLVRKDGTHVYIDSKKRIEGEGALAAATQAGLTIPKNLDSSQPRPTAPIGATVPSGDEKKPVWETINTNDKGTIKEKVQEMMKEHTEMIAPLFNSKHRFGSEAYLKEVQDLDPKVNVKRDGERILIANGDIILYESQNGVEMRAKDTTPGFDWNILTNPQINDPQDKDIQVTGEGDARIFTSKPMDIGQGMQVMLQTSKDEKVIIVSKTPKS